MRVHASFTIGVVLACATTAGCSHEPSAPPDATIDTVAFAPGQGAVHGFLDASAVNVVALPDASLRLKRVSDNSLTAIVTTDVQGAFISSNVPAGTYVICLSGTPGFSSVCSQTQFAVTAGKIAYPPHAVFSPLRTAVYGRVKLSDGADVRYENQLFGKFVDTFVKATTTTGVLVSGPVRANTRGQYVLRQLPPGMTVKIVATSENTTVQNTIVVPTSPVKQDFTLPNRRPAVSEVQALQNGKTVRHVIAGDTVHAKVLASDPDGHALHYQWKVLGGSCPATDAPEVDCTMPLALGTHSIYVQISDAHGQYEVGRVRLAVGPPNALFSGKTVTNGNVVVPNAELVVNGLTVMTNGAGTFSLTVPEAPRYVFTIKKDGFQTISKIFLHEKVGKTYKLLPAKADILDPTKDNTISIRLPQGSEGSYKDATVKIRANSIIDGGGNPVAGPVTAYSSRFDHLNLFDKFDRMPGDTGATNALGEDVTLQSLGAVEVNLRGPAGEKYNIAPGMPSDLTYPVHPSQVGIATPTIPLWYYNEKSGLWEEDGKATLVGSDYVAQAKHFSAINVDLEKVNATCLKLVVDLTRLNPTFRIRLTVPGYPVRDRDVDEAVDALVRLPPNVAASEIVVLDDTDTPIPNSKRIFTTGDVVPAGTNLALQAPYNECITPPSPPVTLSIDLPQNPGTMWLSRISNDETYANNYYTAISADPDLDTWKNRNEFNLGDDAHGVYLNAGDLEFGRNMHMNKRSDGGIAFYVTNYGDAEKAFGDIDHGATVAMEYSNHPAGPGNPKFTKFYVFAPDGTLTNRAELDNRGDKFVPGLCIVCHGGTKPPDIIAANGNTDSKFIPFDLHSYDTSPLFPNHGFPVALPRAAQEEDFRKMNEGIYFFTPATDAQKAMIDGLYPGGVTLVNETQHDDINHIPVNWQVNATDKTFYNTVVRPSCRACHMSRTYPLDWGDGTAFQNGGTFFAACDPNGGYMPQSFVTWRNFWHSVTPGDPGQPGAMEVYMSQGAGTCTGPQ